MNGHSPPLTDEKEPDSLLIPNQQAINHGERAAMGGIIERQKELRQRRHRKKKLKVFKRRLAKATPSEKAHIATKIRHLTPGGSVIVANLGLEERK